jgi:hypothetical protein
MDKMIRIEEVIHHGDYRSRRVVEVYAINAVTVDAVLTSSAYCYSSKLNGSEKAQQMLAGLVEDLKAGRENRSIGWSTFRVID